MYNFLNYFLAVYIIVFGTIIFWFLNQYCHEKKILKQKSKIIKEYN
tara:strand:+ start:227 stop:364 length:138 start_codon:yes stop_codon:yes gene_type:complete